MTPTIQQQLRDVLNTSIQDTTHHFAGIALSENGESLSNDICTVHTTWEGGCEAVFLMRADRTLLTRLARIILHSEAVAPQDIEDVAMEYFNIICGRVAHGLFQVAHIPTRFQVPRFHPCSYLPEDEVTCRCVMNYSSGEQESVQLAFLGLSPSTPPQ